MQRILRQLVYWALQPALIAGALYLVYIDAPLEVHLNFTLLAFVAISVLEIMIPARVEWRKSLKEVAALFAFAFIAMLAYGLVETLYDGSLFIWMDQLRNTLGLDIWPNEWPMIAQVLLIFAAFEFVNYWYHRAAHQWAWLWKLSGHGVHHSFKKLSGLNAIANHPIEAFFLILPRAIVGFLLGGEVAGAAVVTLTTITAILAHSNLQLNSAVIGWFFTTNRYHIHHHSQVREQSDTNYGCVCILWDRLFGTFKNADTSDTGIADTQPGYKTLFIMPFKRER